MASAFTEGRHLQSQTAPSTVSVIGLGYIGLPTAVVCAQAGWTVYGCDSHEERVRQINHGIAPFIEKGLEQQLASVVADARLQADTRVHPADVWIICVPTPITVDHEADLTHVFHAAEMIAPVLTAGNLVLVESTIPVGTTEKVRNIIEQRRPDLRDNVFYAHSPERVLPGRILEELVHNDRVVGGINEESTRRAARFYRSVVSGHVSTTDVCTAELVKLLENAYRDVNIAFANEVSLICDELGINPWEAISLANHHPRVNILQPGPGVGGHCIAVDPWFIVQRSQRAHLIHAARKVNDSKPQHVIEQIEHALRSTTDTEHVAFFGLSFKADVDDLRSSPAVQIVRHIVNAHPDRTFHVVEPHIHTLPGTLEHAHNLTLSSAQEAINTCRVLVLLVDHAAFHAIDPQKITQHTIVDTRGKWRGGDAE